MLVINKPDSWIRIDLYVDTTTDNLLELEHHAGFTNLAYEL